MSYQQEIVGGTFWRAL